MRLYFAVGPNSIQIEILKRCEVNNVLTSFAFSSAYRKFLEQSKNWIPENTILDSGAFSVWTKGNTIDIDKYVEFCKEAQELNDRNLYFVNLDVLPGKFGQYPTSEQREESAKQGWENMLYIESKGLKVIPVFHQHENFEWLNKIRKHTNYIGISPANDVSKRLKEKWLDNVFYIIKDSIKTHGFGVTSFSILKKFPFYSVDSTSWLSGARFKGSHIFENGKLQTLNYKNIENLDRIWNKLEIKKDYFNSYRTRIAQGIKAQLETEQFLTELWEKRGITWNDK